VVQPLSNHSQPPAGDALHPTRDPSTTPEHVPALAYRRWTMKLQVRFLESSDSCACGRKLYPVDLI